MESTLEGLGLINCPRLTVFNKIDRVAGPEFIAGSLKSSQAILNGQDTGPSADGYGDLLISAELGFGLEELRTRLAYEIGSYVKRINNPT